jgi:hypothetical protein
MNLTPTPARFAGLLALTVGFAQAQESQMRPPKRLRRRPTGSATKSINCPRDHYKMNSERMKPVFAYLSLVICQLIAGCANHNLHGEFMSTAAAIPENTRTRTYVVFADEPIFTATGLSSLRIGTPKTIVGSPEIAAAFRQIAARIDAAIPNLSVLTRFQSTRPASPIPDATHLILLTPRNMKMTGPMMTSDVEVVVRDTASQHIIWKGEINISNQRPDIDTAANDLLLLIRRIGLDRSTP